jgi:hypothetical protein
VSTNAEGEAERFPHFTTTKGTQKLQNGEFIEETTMSVMPKIEP